MPVLTFLFLLETSSTLDPDYYNLVRKKGYFHSQKQVLMKILTMTCHKFALDVVYPALDFLEAPH